MISNESREILKSPNKPLEFILGLIFLFSLYLIGAGLDIFNNTLISFEFLLLFITIGAVVAFIILWYATKRFLAFYKILVVACLIGGGVFFFISLYMNMKLGGKELSTEKFMIQSCGTLAQGMNGECEKPYAVIDFHGFEKQLVMD